VTQDSIAASRDPRVRLKAARFDRLRLKNGAVLEPLHVAYETYGTLNADGSNAVLICHALTMDQFVASDNPVAGTKAWWPGLVGPGRAIDTDQYFVICSNILGGCMGTTGPASDMADGRAFGLDFPSVSVADMVEAQRLLIDHLGIERLFMVVGGSVGGMQAMQWASAYPARVNACVLIATAARHSAQNIAFYEVGRQAIARDPNFRGGFYAREDGDLRPTQGLAVARMAAHITYLSEASLEAKFRDPTRRRKQDDTPFRPATEIEGWLDHTGRRFVERFDACSYLYITRASDDFDLSADHGGELHAAFRGSTTRFCVVSFSSDWHYPPLQNREIARAINAAGAPASYVEITTDKGHDAFLIESELRDGQPFPDAIRAFTESAAQAVGIGARRS
jgi:homoserine O-acetyltransferase/O-succinyltransferase